MTVDEIIARLNEIQKKAYTPWGISSVERVEWRGYVADLDWLGYTIRHKTIKDGNGRKVGTIWRAVKQGESKRVRHFTAEWKNVNMRPNDGKPYCKGDCTTRAMSYCLQGVFTYREIETEQYRLARVTNEERGLIRGDYRRKVRRNSQGTWDSIMTDLGYRWIALRGTVRRDNLAVYLREIPHPAITLSSGHVAVVDRGMVVDSWDSRHGRCMKILVNGEDYDRIIQILRANNAIY